MKIAGSGEMGGAPSTVNSMPLARDMHDLAVHTVPEIEASDPILP